MSVVVKFLGLTDYEPVWRAMQESTAESIPGSREPLERTQVCVIGGGIAGLTTAYLLRRAGHEVQLLEATGALASGETGRTTAHLSSVLDDGFHRLEHLFGTDGARLTERGLPTPNLFTGGQDYHSVREWASVQDMAAAAATAVELIRLWGEDARLRRSG